MGKDRSLKIQNHRRVFLPSLVSLDQELKKLNQANVSYIVGTKKSYSIQYHGKFLAWKVHEQMKSGRKFRK